MAGGRDNPAILYISISSHVGRLSPPSWPTCPLGLVACIAYVFQWGDDGKQPLIVSLGTTSRLSSNQLEDNGSSSCVLYLALSVFLRLM